MRNKSSKGSIFNQILFALVGVFLIVIVFSSLVLIEYHNRNQDQKFKDFSKTIGVSLSHFYQRAIAEIEIGKIVIHNSEVVKINPKILYICVRLNDYDKIILNTYDGKWKEMDVFSVDTPMNTGRIDYLNRNKIIPNSEMEIYEYLYPIIQNDTELGWFLIGVDISEDRKEFQKFLTGIVLFEIGLFFILVFISYIFTKRITSPIISLHDSVKRFARGEKNVEVNITAKNELFDLGQSFNQMTKRIAEINEELELKVNERTQELNENIEKLKKAQLQAQDAAMQAGMAEIATNVLHNVGNVLNSVNVSAGAIKDILFDSNVNNLPKISNLFIQHKDNIGDYLSNDSRGKLIPDYLVELSKEILNEKNSLRAELDRLIIKINSIKEIIVLQQDFASRSEVKEKVNLKELINDSIVISGLNTIKTKVNLNLLLEELPIQILNKHKVVQILVNLLKNSKEALLEHEANQERNITITLKKNNEKTFQIKVSDNGPGVSPENLKSLFQHGFTTKRTGHGFGLHGAANDAKHMGGQLYCESEGLGKGATFIFELPFA